MNRGGAYKLLTSRLGELRSRGYDALHCRVGQPVTSDVVELVGEPIVIEVEVTWADRELGTLCVRASALGPSTWRMERLDESFVIGPDLRATKDSPP